MYSFSGFAPTARPSPGVPRPRGEQGCYPQAPLSDALLDVRYRTRCTLLPSAMAVTHAHVNTPDQLLGPPTRHRRPHHRSSTVEARHDVSVSQGSDRSDHGWTMSDAWVFATIANDRPPASHTLTELIAIADGINHCVLTEEEFSRAVGRLLSAGLIEVDSGADRYWPTQAGARIREPWRHGLFGWIEAIPPQLRRLGEPPPTAWSLPHGTFDQAVRTYLARRPTVPRRHG